MAPRTPKAADPAPDAQAPADAEAGPHARFLDHIEAAVGLGLWQFDPISGLITASRTNQELFGLDPVEEPRPADDFNAVIHPDDTETVLTAWKHTLENELPHRVEYRAKLPHGTRWFETAAWPMRLGKRLQYMGYTRDITEHRLAMEREEESRRLRESEALRSRIMSKVAHELQNPLTPLHLQLSLLRNASKDETTLRTVDLLERNVQRITTLVQDLQDASHLGDGRVTLHATDVDLSEHVRAAVEDYAGVASENGLDLRAEADDDLRVRADPNRLEQVLANLLSNACKYTPPGGSIRVLARNDGDDVRVEVEDTGVGIEPEAADRLFEPFERGERPPRAKDRSTGLGLYIVKELVALQGGRVGVRSKGLDEGSAFWFSLPQRPVDGP